jgi:HEAT repeat protein
VGDPADAQLLVSSLESSHPSVRVAAIRAVATLKAQSLKNKLVEQLNSRLSSIRRSALEALLKMKSTGLSEKFIAFTRDDAPSVRLVACRAIGKLKINQGIKTLVKRFGDRNKYVRQAAVDSIVSIGTDAAARQAATALSSDLGRARACSSQALGRLQNSHRLQQHVELLRDDYVPARRWASWALGEIGDSTVAPDLYQTAFRKDQDVQVKAAAILSLGKLGYDRVLGKCHRLLPQKPTKDKPGEPTPVRVACARAMGFIKDREGISSLTDRIKDDGEEKGIADNVDVRAESAIALARIGVDDSVITLLREHMRDPEEMRRVRVACQWAIKQITGSEPSPGIPPYPAPSPNYFARSLQGHGN